MHLLANLFPHPILDLIEACLRLQLLHLALHLLPQLGLLLLVALQLNCQLLDLLVQLGLAVSEIPRSLFEALLEFSHLLVIHGLPLRIELAIFIIKLDDFLQLRSLQLFHLIFCSNHPFPQLADLLIQIQYGVL